MTAVQIEALEGAMIRAPETKIAQAEVRKIRKAMGLTQEEFARFLWITCTTLNRWEAGRGAPFGMHLRILILLQKHLAKPSFRRALQHPRAEDLTFLLYRLLQLTYED